MSKQRVGRVRRGVMEQACAAGRGGARVSAAPGWRHFRVRESYLLEEVSSAGGEEIQPQTSFT